MALQLFLEERLAELDGVVFARLIESSFAPGRLCGLDDERGVPLLVLIGVHPPQAMLIALEVEGESGEGTSRSQPDKAVGSLVHRGLKMLGVPFPHRAIEPIRADHEVGVDVYLGILHILANLHAHSQRLAMLSQHRYEFATRYPTEPKAARRDHEA